MERHIPSADHAAAVRRLARERGGDAAVTVAAWSRAGAELIEILTRPFDDIGDLDREDLVHGDVGPGNVIFSSPGRAVFVDVDNLGFGSRAIDLAAMYMRTVQSGDDDAKTLLGNVGADVAGKELFDTCVAITMMGNIAWVIAHAPERADARIAAYTRDRT